MESESIIPEWLFKTTIVIEPERIEFKAPSRIESFGPIAANVAHELHVVLTNEEIGLIFCLERNLISERLHLGLQ